MITDTDGPHSVLWALFHGNTELKQRRGRRQREQQKAIGLDEQKKKNNFARASRIFAHFLAIVARLPRETF